MRSARVWALLFLLIPASTVRSGEGEVRLLTDDAIPRYLARGQELARAKQWDKVVDVLHRVVIGDQEVFPDLKEEVLNSAVYSEDGRLFYPARELCLKELARLPPEGLSAYRAAFDVEAKQLFKRAEAVERLEERLQRYAEVYDKYLPSTVGDDALEKAANINLSLGRYYEALALYRRLIDLYPKDTDRDLPMVFAKAAFCAARIGDREHRNVLLERLRSEHPAATVEIEGKAVGTGELADHPLLKVRGDEGLHEEQDWPLAGGNTSRSRAGQDLPPDLPRKPYWSYSLAKRDPRLNAAYRVWVVNAHDREPSPEPQVASTNPELLRPYPTVRPVVHDGLVIYKDYLEIVARRLGSGSFVLLCGRYRPPDGTDNPQFLVPLDHVRPGMRGNSKDARKYEGIYRWLDYGGNSIVVSNDHMIVTESETPPHELRSEAAGQRGRPNMLVCYSRRTGKMLWAWHHDYCAMAVRNDPALYEAWQRDFQKHSAPLFHGPGVVSGGIVYTLVEEQDEVAGVALWAVDAATGRVRFRTPLHYPDEVRKLLPRGAALAVAGGVVYVVTHSGIVAAVDALPPGRVRWITRYDRNYSRRGGRSQRGFTRGHIPPGFAFNDPIVTGGKVIIMPTDASELVALDAETGRTAWRVPKRALGSVYHVVGVSDGILVLAGDKVRAIEVATGRGAWGPKDLKGWPAGRGFVGERYAYIPTSHENARISFIERFDLLTGGREAALEFDVKKLGNLLSVDGRLIVANGDEIMCFTSFEKEFARLDAAINGDGAKAPLYLERGLLALTGEVKRRDQAREDFRRSLEAAAREKSDDVSTRVHALENLFAIARERMDLAALDAAAEIVKPLAARPAVADEGKRHPYEAQIALERVELLGRLGRGEEALDALEHFQDSFGHMRVVREGRVVDASAAASKLREHLRATNTAFRIAFEKSVRGRVRAAAERKDVEELRAIPARYGYESPSEEAFFALTTVYEEKKDYAQAENVLRGFLDRFPDHRLGATAHLRLARVLARQGNLAFARRETSEGLSRLDELGRAKNRFLIAELGKLLDSGGAAVERARLAIPMVSSPLGIKEATPVPIEGGIPGSFTLLATAKEYIALDDAGNVKWRQPNPTETGVLPGPADDADTAVLAARIAVARVARMVGDDLLIGDYSGLTRLDAKTGDVRWRYPDNAAQARTEAIHGLDLLRADLRLVKTTGHALRSHPLPTYTLAGNVVVRVHPKIGVEALNANTGGTIWFDPDAAGAVSVGAPSLFGELMAVGWSKPGWIRVYNVRDGAHVNTFRKDGLVVVAPPVLDPLGRIVIIHSRSKDGSGGELGIFNVRGNEPALPASYRVPTSNAAVLHADGKLLVYHDGGSGTENLHFVDLERSSRESRRTSDMMRSFEVIRDGDQLFVFTCNPGLEDEGARLFRVDLKAANSFAYDLGLTANAFGRPVLTQRYVALVASLPRLCQVRLFDREASGAARAAQPVFLVGGAETANLDFRPTGAPRYTVAPSVAVSGGALVVGHPFGTFRLQAREAR